MDRSIPPSACIPPLALCFVCPAPLIWGATTSEQTHAFRVSDTLAGERVSLLYIGNGSEQDLRAWCRERLASYQQPSLVRAVDRIPRQANGKVSRRDVAASIAAEAEARA